MGVGRLRGGRALAIAVPLLAAAGCAMTSPGLTTRRSQQVIMTANTDGTMPVAIGDTTTTSPPGPTTTGTAAAPVSVGTLTWGTCKEQPSPWQCATLTVPLDYSQPSGATIGIALNRLPAADPAHRIGSLVVNPGGPGGSGVDLAFNEGEAMPKPVRDSFDIVGFDPRGVGRSAPVSCSSMATSLDSCIAHDKAELPFLGTVSVARDLDAIRAAIGDDKITYLGYSYGTALGAVYADMFPTHIRALVLDGTVDPAAGAMNAPGKATTNYYAIQDFSGTLRIFEQLCNLAPSCLAGPDSSSVVQKVGADVDTLPVDHFAGAHTVAKSDLADLIQQSMYNVQFWPALAVALSDAAAGDASALAAYASFMQFGYPAQMMDQPDFNYAHIAIDCADFSSRGNDNSDCSSFPATAAALPAITPATGAPTIVVVGTRGDPATPWHYAGEMAKALGNAVSITWEGAGHTAYLTSKCVTQLVTSYLVDLTVPANGADCPFVVGATSRADIAAHIFAPGDPMTATLTVENVLEAQGKSPTAASCISTALIKTQNERLIVHEELGVNTPDLAALTAAIAQGCGG